jgi:NAD(P)H-dependent FMN reductase
MDKPILLIIIGSTRPTRVGGDVAKWVCERAREHGEFEVDVADLREIDLPLLDEPEHPAKQDYQHDHTKAWAERVDVSDAFVFVHPEYNYGLNAATKNALDYLNKEWKGKPAGVVSYGGVSAGQRAANQLFQTFASLKITPAATVPIPSVSEKFEDDEFTPNEPMEEGLRGMFDELARIEPGLREIREKQTTEV